MLTWPAPGGVRRCEICYSWVDPQCMQRCASCTSHVHDFCIDRSSGIDRSEEKPWRCYLCTGGCPNVPPPVPFFVMKPVLGSIPPQGQRISSFLSPRQPDQSCLSPRQPDQSCLSPRQPDQSSLSPLRQNQPPARIHEAPRPALPSKFEAFRGKSAVLIDGRLRCDMSSVATFLRAIDWNVEELVITGQDFIGWRKDALAINRVFKESKALRGSLKRVKVANNNIYADMGINILDALAGMPQLERIDLSTNEICGENIETAKGPVTFAATLGLFLRNTPTVGAVNICNNRHWDPKSFSEYYKAAKSSKRLCEFGIVGTDFQPKQIKEMKQLMERRRLTQRVPEPFTNLRPKRKRRRPQPAMSRQEEHVHGQVMSRQRRSSTPPADRFKRIPRTSRTLSPWSNDQFNPHNTYLVRQRIILATGLGRRFSAMITGYLSCKPAGESEIHRQHYDEWEKLVRFWTTLAEFENIINEQSVWESTFQDPHLGRQDSLKTIQDEVKHRLDEISKKQARSIMAAWGNCPVSNFVNKMCARVNAVLDHISNAPQGHISNYEKVEVVMVIDRLSVFKQLWLYRKDAMHWRRRDIRGVVDALMQEGDIGYFLPDLEHHIQRLRDKNDSVRFVSAVRAMFDSEIKKYPDFARRTRVIAAAFEAELARLPDASRFRVHLTNPSLRASSNAPGAFEAAFN